MPSRAPLIAVVLTLLLAGVVVLVWGRTLFTSVSPVAQADLEQQVASLYTPDTAGDDVAASCDGDLAAEVDASQDCQVQVGGDVARVHVVVDEVDGKDVRFQATPYLSAADVAETIKSSLDEQGFAVDTVRCTDELPGVEGREITCTYTPPASGRAVTATVTAVDGPVINIEYDVGAAS